MHSTKFFPHPIKWVKSQNVSFNPILFWKALSRMHSKKIILENTYYICSKNLILKNTFRNFQKKVYWNILINFGKEYPERF